MNKWWLLGSTSAFTWPLQSGEGAPAGADPAASPSGGDEGGGSPPPGDGAAANEGGEGSGGTAAPPSPSPVKDWREARMGEMSAKLRDARAEIARLQAAQAAPAPAPGTQPAAPAAGDAAVEAELNRRAQAMAVRQEFARRCNEVVEQGQQKFQDFDARLQSLRSVVDFGDQAEVAAFDTLVQAALETGIAPALIHELGGVPERARTILKMSPLKMASEITKMSIKPTEEVSNVPKPATPIGNRGQQHTPFDPSDVAKADKVSTAAWMEAREKQVAARRKTA